MFDALPSHDEIRYHRHSTSYLDRPPGSPRPAVSPCDVTPRHIPPSACVQHHQAAGPLLVEDPVAALAAPDRVPGADLVLLVAVAADVDCDAGLGLLLLVHRSCDLRRG